MSSNNLIEQQSFPLQQENNFPYQPSGIKLQAGKNNLMGLKKKM